jgi:cytochrome c biogenesis protein CcdA
MILLFGFAFLAGIVTVLSPCILPVLPIVLAGSVDGDKKKPLGIITGFICSFTFFTLFLSTIVRATGLPSESLRTFSIIVIFIFGISLLIPQVQVWIEQLFSKLANSGPKQTQQNNSFWGGIVVGLSLGLLWTPCVGPILASVISLALTGSVTGSAFFIHRIF